MQQHLFELQAKYEYQGRYFYFVYMEGEQSSYIPLIMQLQEEYPEWELVQVLQRTQIVPSQNKIKTLGNDGNMSGASAIQIFTPLFKTEVKNYDKLPEPIKQNICHTLNSIRKIK